jgi:hypothetical protein
MVKAGAGRRAAVLVCLLGVSGCGSIEDDGLAGSRRTRARPPGGAASAGAAEADALLYLGRWYGTTSQGLSFAFTVDDGEPAAGVTAITYAWQLPSCSFHDEVRFEEPAAIQDGALSVEIEAPGSLLDLALTFDDASRAHGTLAFAATRLPTAPSCVGSGAVPFAVAKRPGD